MPLWAAVTVVAVAYVIRSIARGFDFTPDIPTDVLLLGIFVGILILVAGARRALAPDDGHDALAQQVEHEDDEADSRGKVDDVLGKIE